SHHKKVVINMIPYNPTDVGTKHEFKSPSDEDLDKFRDIVMSYDLFVTVRKSTTSGQDIDGACGQLALKGSAKKIKVTRSLKSKIYWAIKNRQMALYRRIRMQATNPKVITHKSDCHTFPLLSIPHIFIANIPCLYFSKFILALVYLKNMTVFHYMQTIAFFLCTLGSFDLFLAKQNLKKVQRLEYNFVDSITGKIFHIYIPVVNFTLLLNLLHSKKNFYFTSELKRKHTFNT
ncbi:hypothetical protein RFI_25154, partial [Reticulomyxa filosa]